MKSYRLRNGARVFLAPMNGTAVMTALILFKVGSRNERKINNGVSHFVEHLFFKGTTQRPTTLDISKELDGVGAEYNAFTGKDFTGYYVKVASHHAALALDILSDILFHPIFDPAEIDRERGVIIEEINMYEDNPQATSEELAESLLFGKNHPLGFRIAGPRENIARISRKDILAYRDTYYHPENMVVIVTGHLPSPTGALIRQYFGSVKNMTPRALPAQKFRFQQRQPRVHLERKKTAQAHLALTFPGPTYHGRDLLIAEVLSAIVGGNMSSRLFINVRERLGLCYYIRSGVTPYEDAGAFTIHAGFDKRRIQDALDAIMRELAMLRSTAVDALELRKATEYLRGKMSLQLEDTEHVAAWWGRQALFYPQPRDAEAYMRAIAAVTASQVQRLAKKIFTVQQANLVVIGPYPHGRVQSLHRVLRKYS